MKHSVGLFSVFVLMLFTSSLYSRTISPSPHISPISSFQTSALVQLGGIIDLVWKPDGSELAVGYADGTIQILDTSGQLIRTFQIDTGLSLHSIDWSFIGNKLSVADGRWLYILDALTGEILLESGGGYGLFQAKWHPKIDQIAITGEGLGFTYAVYLLDPNTGDTLQTIEWLYDEGIDALEWNFDGSYLALGDGRGQIGIWNAETGEFSLKWEASIGNNIRSIAWSPDGTKIANSTNNWSIQVWDAMKGTGLFDTSRAMEEISWSPDGTLLAGIAQNEIQFWNAETGELLDTISEMGIRHHISWSPDGIYLAYVGASGTPVIIPAPQLQTPTPSATIQSEAQSLRSVFNAPTCQRACWLGIEPGVTTQDEVRIILSDLGIAYEAKDELGIAPPKQDNPFGWLPDDDLAFIDTTDGQREVRVYFVQGLVHSIKVPVHISLDLILEAYGAPDQVQHLGDNAYELIYHDSGMNFYFNSLFSTEYAVMLTLFSEAGALQYVLSFDSPYLLQDCTLFSTPCTIATATPVPIFTPSATIQSEAQVLRDLLSYPTCQRTCFIGIEPGVTTQDEVKAYFAANNITHTVFAGIKNDDEPNGIYYWHLDSTLPFVTSNEVSSDVQFKDGIVGVIELFVDVPIPAILEAYGAPQIFLKSDSVYLLIYPTEKLAFQVMKHISTEKANLVYIVTDEVLDEFLKLTLDQHVQNCMEPTVVCAVQTATPTP